MTFRLIAIDDNTLYFLHIVNMMNENETMKRIIHTEWIYCVTRFLKAVSIHISYIY